MSSKYEELTKDLNSAEECSQKIAEINKKFRMTMYGVMVCVLLYLIALFAIKNTTLVLIICIPMIILAVMNNRYGKQIRMIAQKRQEFRDAENRLKEQNPEAAEGDIIELPVEDIKETMSNVKSLNDLPKDYTVLDQVMINNNPAAHIIVSPYGVAVVDEVDRTDDLKAVLQGLEIDAPVFWYAPVSDDELLDLAARIQSPRTVVLTEQEIYKILYRLNGLA